MKNFLWLLAVISCHVGLAQSHHRSMRPNNHKLCCDQSLAVGSSMESRNGRFFLVLQDDRNLVLYMKVGAESKPLWATGTNNNADRFVMQTDGNFVVYNGTRPTWASGTNGNPNASLILQDDGNLVIYSTDGRALWSTNTTQAPEPVASNKLCCDQEVALGGALTSLNDRFFLAFQKDRNVVVYMKGGDDARALWATATNNNADRCVMQADGNLVIYNGTRAVWASNTNGNKDASLVMQDDGNLVIYDTNGKPIWHTNTAQATMGVVAPIVAPVIPVIAPVIVPVVETVQAPVASTEPCSMPAQQFDAALHAVDAQAFKDPKLKMAKVAIKGKCLSLEQIRTMAKLFSFEDQTLDFLKYAYDFTNSKSEYYTLADLFAFNSNTENFTAFLESK